jgi:aminoglycoside phosphotransferase family enzyme/predicted kinase
MHLPDLIAALSQPGAYPQPVATIEVRQTHISVVFLADPFVYKIKKPVHPEFLDFRTLELRRHFCDEEVRLNRRLAPQVYLGVVPIVRTPSGVRVEGTGEAIEWAVKMQRLPDDATLQQRLRRGEVTIEQIEALARRIAAFHRQAETNERIAAFGRFEAVARNIRDVFAQATPHVGTTVSEAVFDRTQRRADDELTRLRPLIEERARQGRPRDCHGDLHLDHVYCFPDRPPPDDLVVIDCIEFNERFRFIDPIADMAFAAMDLTFHGRRDLVRSFTDAYFRAAGDAEGPALLPLYSGYRAAVRGMVEGMLLAEKETPEAERDAVRVRARAHWLLALTELEEPGRKPCLLLVAGLPGTGKSTVARDLAARASFHVIRSDQVRKELAGVSSLESLAGAALYTPDWNERTYAECLHRAERLLWEGQRVLVDATFRQEQYRRTFLEAAERWGVPAGLLVCQAEPATVRTRLEQRHGDVSDADWSVCLQAAQSWEAIGPLTRRSLHTISTEGNAEQAVGRALEVLRRLNGWRHRVHGSDHPSSPQLGDTVRVQRQEFAQHAVGILSKSGWRSWRWQCCASDVKRTPHEVHWPALRIMHRHAQPAGRRLRVGEHVGVIPHRRVRYPDRHQSLLPGSTRLAAHDLLDHRHKHGPVLHPRPIRGESLVGGQVGSARHLAKPLPLLIVAHGEHQPTVGRWKQLVWDDLQVGVALPRGHLAAAQVRLGEVDLGCHGTIQQRQVDGVAVPRCGAGVEAGEHSHRRVQPRQHVGHRHADLARRPLDRAGNAHQSAQCLDREVVAGQVAERSSPAEPGDRADDQPRVEGQERLGPQAEPVGAGGFEVFQKHIAAPHQLLKEPYAFGLGEVEGDGTLVAVAREIVRAERTDERWAPAARLVAAAGPFDLDDLGPEVAEDLPTERGGQHPRCIQDADSGQWAV